MTSLWNPATATTTLSTGVVMTDREIRKRYLADVESRRNYVYSTNPGLIVYAEDEQQEANPVRQLFEVFIVDPETEDVRLHMFIIAANESTARLKAWARGMRESTLTAIDEDHIDHFDIIVRLLGSLSPKRSVREG